MRSILAKILTTVLAASALVSGAAADDRAYACDNAGNLSLLNFTTGSNTLVGNLGAVGTLESLAYDPLTGLVYAVNSSGQFYHIDPSGPTATLISSLGIGNIESLDMIGGRLIGVDFAQSPTVYEINPATGVATVISVSTNIVSNRSRALAMTSAGSGMLSNFDELMSIDLNSGAIAVVGPFGVGSIFCMDFVGGTLYGVSSNSGDYYEINTATGAATLTGNFGTAWYLGLAPIEELVGDWAYANDTNGNIYSIDFTTATSTLLGNTIAVTGNLIESMAYDGDAGLLYAISSTGNMYRIDTGTIAATFIGNTGLGNVEALDMINGRLLGYSFSSNAAVYQIDTNTASPILLTSGSSPLISVPRAAALFSEDLAYLADGSQLTTFDNITGTVTGIGPMAATMGGMDFINGTLYGVTGGSQLYQIDTGTAASTLLGSLGGQFFLSLAGVDTTPPPLVINGELTATSLMWDRVTDTGFIPGPCGTATAFDSFNDGQPYDQYKIAAIDPTQPVGIEMVSLELTPADFDPFMAIYCDSFAPFMPAQNIFDADDDGGNYPDASMQLLLEAGREYRLVASSYASYAPARYGKYQLIITNATAQIVCLADLNNDGFLDSGDISAFVSLFLAGDLAADLNQDGFLDSGDISAFVTLFLAGC